MNKTQGGQDVVPCIFFMFNAHKCCDWWAMDSPQLPCGNYNNES